MGKTLKEIKGDLHSVISYFAFLEAESAGTDEVPVVDILASYNRISAKCIEALALIECLELEKKWHGEPEPLEPLAPEPEPAKEPFLAELAGIDDLLADTEAFDPEDRQFIQDSDYEPEDMSSEEVKRDLSRPLYERERKNVDD